MAILSDIFSGFFTTMKGMAVTGKELFRKPVTLLYPYKKREIPERFRGTLVNDVNDCTACNACSRICPVNCFEIEGEGKGKNRKPTLFAIDYVKCCWCALCVEACPQDCLTMSHDYETVFTDRSLMKRDFVKDPYKPIVPREEKSAASKESEEAKEEGKEASVLTA
ncbi:MAG: NADH-quinone oxidoreductase subunit I [Candidatus Omnitrophota bacterium]